MPAVSSPVAFADLDNPFWSALRSRHADLAWVAGEVARYPATHAPFLGVAHAEVEAGEAFATLVAPGESSRSTCSASPRACPRAGGSNTSATSRR